MIVVVRISGMVNVPKEKKNSLERLRLKRKYSAVLLKNTVENLKILKKTRDYVAYGTISKEMLEKLISLRAEPKNKGEKIDSKKIISDLEKKEFKDLEIKPFFRLHPPRKGIESKKHFGVGKGVLGDNKEKINDLLERML